MSAEIRGFYGTGKLRAYVKRITRYLKDLDSNDLAKILADTILEECVVECPVRTGHLRDSHSVKSITKRYIRIGNDARYAYYVHEGFIHYRSGKFIPPNPWIIRGTSKGIKRFEESLKRSTENLRLPKSEDLKKKASRKQRVVK